MEKFINLNSYVVSDSHYIKFKAGSNLSTSESQDCLTSGTRRGFAIGLPHFYLILLQELFKDGSFLASSSSFLWFFTIFNNKIVLVDKILDSNCGSLI